LYCYWLMFELSLAGRRPKFPCNSGDNCFPMGQNINS
jgi:hypothetical protein